MSMTDPIDVTDKLPPVRKPWRDNLPKDYRKHIDELLALSDDINAMRKRLN
jgi:hypothetical protein